MPTLQALNAAVEVKRDNGWGGLRNHPLPEAFPALVGTPVPDTIDLTGQTDQTTQLNAFIASVPDGSTVYFPYFSDVWCQRLQLIDRNNLTIIIPNTAALHQKADPGSGSANYRPVVDIVGGSNITIQGDGSILGAFPDYGSPSHPSFDVGRVGHHGINISGVNGFLIDIAELGGVAGDFIRVGMRNLGLSSQAGPLGYTQSQNGTIRGVHFHNSGRMGISIVSGENITIEGRSPTTRLFTEQVQQTVIDLEPLGYWERVNNVTIQQWTVGRSGLNVLSAAGAEVPTQAQLPVGNATYPAWTVAQYRADPRGFRRINNVTLDDVLLPERPFLGQAGLQSTTDPNKVSDRRTGWRLTNIRSMIDTGSRVNSKGAMFVMYYHDDTFFDSDRATFSGTNMHFARMINCGPVTIGPNMDLAGVPNPASYVGDLLLQTQVWDTNTATWVITSNQSVIGPYPTVSTAPHTWAEREALTWTDWEANLWAEVESG